MQFIPRRKLLKTMACATFVGLVFIGLYILMPSENSAYVRSEILPKNLPHRIINVPSIPVETCDSGSLNKEDELSCTKKNLELARKQMQKLEERMKTFEKSIKKFDRVNFLNWKNRKRILVTGGAGFVGSHLVDRLMLEGHEVTVVDNLFTGSRRNIEHWLGHHNFDFHNFDIVNPFFAEVDEIYHLASPASPPHYMLNPVKTIKTNTLGTINMLGLAKRTKARLVFASTSEVYGDPVNHPQKESYWGNVNPIGPRACYDESKRVGETLCMAYHRYSNVSVGIARIFNTYGPRMHANDGRAVSNFILQALQNSTMTIYGDGTHTRSFQYVKDLVNGLVALMRSNITGPINLGNPVEHSIKDFAQIIKASVGGTSQMEFLPPVEDDPHLRKPDITKAKEELHWEPKIPISEGIPKTVDYFRKEIQRKDPTERNLFDPMEDWAYVITKD